MTTKWTIDSDQSDVLIKMKDATITYLGNETNHFDGFVSIDEDQIEDASVEFFLDSNTFSSQKRDTALQNKNNSGSNKKPLIRFKSTSFQKIKNNINFLKGYLTIKDITKMFEEIRKKFSSLDIVVNVSGIERIYTDPLDTREWKEVLDVNLFGAVECSREALKMMGGGGVIINISSVAGKPGIAYYGESLSYSISKAALNTFSENLAVMLAPRIRVVSISPGYTLTPMWNLSSEKEEYQERVPLKRFITPNEIAHAVIAVAENDAITGTNIVVDAGLTLKEIK